MTKEQINNLTEKAQEAYDLVIELRMYAYNLCKEADEGADFADLYLALCGASNELNKTVFLLNNIEH